MLAGYDSPQSRACSWQDLPLMDAPPENPGSVSALLAYKGECQHCIIGYLNPQKGSLYLSICLDWLVKTC